ncbi:MAG: HAD family hydrolase [Pseudomonadota bacterium]
MTAEKTIKGILFDFDGTLTTPGALDFPAIKRDIGCPEDIPVLEFLEKQPASRRAELMRILDAKEEGAAKSSSPNRGAEECLSTLKEKGILLGIITRNSRKSVILALEKFDGFEIKDFAAIVTREEALPKPNPDGVFKAAALMGLSTAELIVVGDFRFDVMAGKAAGAHTVFLTNGGKSGMLQGDPDPGYSITYLEDIHKIL